MSEPRIVHCEQLSPEWWSARRGLPSASAFHRIITPKRLTLAAGHEDYIHELIGDRFDALYPRITDRLSPEMRHGLEYEAESRRWYTFETGQDVQQVGGVVSACGRWWCSPDGLIGDDIGLELKNPSPKSHVRYLMDPAELLSDYAGQVYGSLIVTGRKRWQIASYCPGLPGVVVEALATDPFAEKLRACLEQFSARLDAALTRFQEAA